MRLSGRKFVAALIIAALLVGVLPSGASLAGALLVGASPSAAVAASLDDCPHFLEKNRFRYEAYRAENPRLSADLVVAYVNANIDLGFYNGIETAPDAESISVLVNKNFSLPGGYAPSDMVSIGGHLSMRAEAAGQFVKMRDEMLALGLRVHVVVTYRSYQTQTSTYNNAVSKFGRENADVSFARPGQSEHQTGLAVDILHMGGFAYMQHSGYEKTKEFEWLTQNAYRYGFILRYPGEHRDAHGFIFEPWHWRYVGVDISTAMFEEGIALFEEYYGRYLAPGLPGRVGAVRVNVRPADIEVGGKKYTIQSFSYEGSSYYRIRDIAYALNGTAKRFSLTYIGISSVIVMQSGAPYAPTGRELRIENAGGATAVPSNIVFIYSGKQAGFKAWAIGGNTFVRLRDAADLVGFGTRYDPVRRCTVIEI